MHLRRAMHPHIKEIAKCERHISEDVKAHIDRTLNDLLGTVVNSVRTELSQDIGGKRRTFFYPFATTTIKAICNQYVQLMTKSKMTQD